MKIKNLLLTASVAAVLSTPVYAGSEIETRDDNVSARIGGWVQADAATYGGDPDIGNGSEIRAAKLHIAGTMYRDWGFKLEYDFAHAGSGGKGISDAYVTYNGFENIEIKVGHFKEPFSLQKQTSPAHVQFMELALPSAMKTSRRLGVMASTKHKYWTLAGGLFGDSLTATNGDHHDEDEAWGASTRATWAPVNGKTEVLHFGVGLNYRNTGGAGAVAFKQQAETHISGFKIVNTGTIDGAGDIYKVGAEVAAVRGPFSAQAEYIATSVNRNSGTDLNFDGWYVQAGYFLTGESQKYKKGKFGGVSPKANVGEGGIGAWELALRYSTLDLTDADIDGGEADSITLGLNWYPTPTLRFSANYVEVLDVDGGVHDNEEPRVFQIRGQWAF